MDQTAFYGVVSAVNFTLLGLWWVAVKDRADLVGGDAASRRMAYFVSLQFVIPATVSLLAQVAPDEPAVWQSAFAIAGVAGVVGVVMLAQQMAERTIADVLPWVFAFVGAPLYLLVTFVALWPDVVGELGLSLAPIEVEGLILTILVFLGVQQAWFVSTTPARDVGEA